MRHLFRVRSLHLQSLFWAPLALSVAVLLSGCGSNNKSASSSTTAAPGTGTNTSTNSGGTSTNSGGGTSSGSGNGSSATTVAYVYTGGTNMNANLISGFSITSDGTAHALPGSPYSGPGGYVVSNGAYLFATDGTNIQSYARNSDGSLTRGPSISGVAHNDTPTGAGVGTLVLDRTGQDLYAGEINFQGADNDATASFAIGSGGALNFIANSAINVNAASRLTFSQDNRFAYGQGCYFINWDLFGMARQSNGSLQFTPTNAAIPPTTIPNATLCPGNSSASAKNYLAVEVGIAGNNVPNGFLVTYIINSDGTLSLVPNSNVQLSFAGGNAMAFDPTGTYLAVGGQGRIQVFQLSSSGMLTPLGTPQQTSATFDAAQWDSSGHLYAVANSNLYIFNFSKGVLTQASGSPYPIATEGSLVVVPAP